MRYADNACRCEESYEPHTYTFIGRCVVTGKEVRVRVPAEELHAYRAGKYIQDAMPSVSVDDREFLLSGYSKEGWDIMFPPE